MSDAFEPRKDRFVGIDSDGCAFDTMEVKHKECFIPNIVKHFKLAAVSKYVREAAEFVNLYSKWRGINRFPALLMTFDLLTERPEVQTRGVTIPTLTKLREWTRFETKLANSTLAQVVAKSADHELRQCLEWSQSVNATIEEVVHHVPPFPLLRECLERLSPHADILVVSATPTDALMREWREHDLDRFVIRICGQETGSKKELLSVAARYAAGHSLMIGDAPGDLSAARANGALFYPINPSREDASWRRFFDEGINRFLNSTYQGAYEQSLIAEFDAYLPELPPWKRN